MKGCFENTLQYDLEDHKINTKLNKKLNQNVIIAINELSNGILHLLIVQATEILIA